MKVDTEARKVVLAQIQTVLQGLVPLWHLPGDPAALGHGVLETCCKQKSIHATLGSHSWPDAVFSTCGPILLSCQDHYLIESPPHPKNSRQSQSLVWTQIALVNK